MTARPPHFECGASTNFATRPWVQLYYPILYLLNLQQKKFKIFVGLSDSMMNANFQVLWMGTSDTLHTWIFHISLHKKNSVTGVCEVNTVCQCC